MDGNRLRLLTALLASTVLATACVTRLPEIPVPAPPSAPGVDHASIVFAADLGPTASSYYRVHVVDEYARLVAVLTSGEYAVVDVAPGRHVFAAFDPSNRGARVGALDVDAAPSREYGVVVRGTIDPMRKSPLIDVEMEVVHADQCAEFVERLPPERKRTLTASNAPIQADREIDRNEAAVGIAKLRIGGDEPDEPLAKLARALGRAPVHRWSKEASTIHADDGVPLITASRSTELR
ncbi:hypothetical protein AKJ09_03157 [Labilithrix luteola]|uniref:DUF4384 domain-containing protein n=1 Tax=Labilithrix luteola TaxID=1391654 RepID=A0A0K1PSI0_9BACT|nr:hypothetical protein [Labilithrix luteola]AKU96493.1 hypothetical protein AKJ09_03157 [Labilithrix luteola]